VQENLLLKDLMMAIGFNGGYQIDDGDILTVAYENCTPVRELNLAGATAYQLTPEDIIARRIAVTHTANITAFSMPSLPVMYTNFSGMTSGAFFNIYIANLSSSYTIALDPPSGWTIYGNVNIAVSSSATLCLQLYNGVWTAFRG
jgi:hypothetical protein